jgi:transcriptional regulator with XRE-family HTH domain
MDPIEPIENVLQQMLHQHPEIAERLRKEKPRARIAAALVRVRNALGYTQHEIAKLSENSQGNVARLEKATGNPQTTEALLAYAKACNLTLGLVFIAQTDNGPAIVEATGIDEDGQSDAFLRTLITVLPATQNKEWYKARHFRKAAAAAASA